MPTSDLDRTLTGSRPPFVPGQDARLTAEMSLLDVDDTVRRSNATGAIKYPRCRHGYPAGGLRGRLPL